MVAPDEGRGKEGEWQDGERERPGWDAHVGQGDRAERGHEAARGPGGVEGGHDRPPEVVLDRDGLHVGRRVVGPQPDAVDRHARDEQRQRPVAPRRLADDDDAHGDEAEGDPQGQSAVAAAGEQFGRHRPPPGEDDEQQHQSGQLELGELEERLELREPEGERDEEQSLHGERAGDGATVAAGGELGRGRGGHGLHRGPRAGRRPGAARTTLAR